VLRASSLLLLCAAIAGAETLRIDSCDPVARPGLPLHLQVTGRSEQPWRLPRVLQVRLLHDEQVLAATRIALPGAGHLAAGADLWLIPPRRLPAGELRCEARLLRHDQVTAAATEQIVSWTGLLERVAEVDAALQGNTEPLPQLWLEQAALLASRPPTQRDTEILRELLEHSQAWRDGRRDWRVASGASAVRAMRCPADGSVQPYRVHRPDAAAKAVALVLRGPQTAPDKVRWPALGNALRDAARRRGLALVEYYPAGDRDHRGIALRRCAESWRRLLARHELDGLPLVLIALEHAAPGALLLAADMPEQLRALLLADPLISPAPQVPAALEPSQRQWLRARSDVQAYRTTLHDLPLAIAGSVPAQSEAALAQWRATRFTAPWHDQATTWLLAQSQMDLAVAHDETLVLEPGRYGPLRVLAMQDWAKPGRLLPRADGTAIDSEGVALLAWLGDGARPELHGAAWAEAGELARPAKVAGQARGPLASYADGPFAVVIGADEHLQAMENNRLLGQRFLDDWVAHAHGAPPWCYDRDYAEHADDWSDRNLVLIGNPRSNAVLGDMVGQGLELPISWDHRSVSVAGQQVLRSSAFGLALCWPHPAQDGRLLVILDGRAVWRRDGSLPLSGLPDLHLQTVHSAGTEDAEGAAVPQHSELFDQHWRSKR